MDGRHRIASILLAHSLFTGIRQRSQPPGRYA